MNLRTHSAYAAEPVTGGDLCPWSPFHCIMLRYVVVTSALATCLQVVRARIPVLRGTIWVDIPRQELLHEAALDSNPAVQQLVQAATASADSQSQGSLRVPLKVDISIGMGDSTAAVRYLQRQVRLGTVCLDYVITSTTVVSCLWPAELLTYGSLGAGCYVVLTRYFACSVCARFCWLFWARWLLACRIHNMTQ